MATNTIKTRIQHKNGSASDWSQATTFIPLKGELIIYNDATTPKIKVGDGTTLVESLPFVGASITMNGAIASSPSFYAPTSAGTAGQVLKSQGSDKAPTWATEYSYTLPAATASTLGGVKIGSNISVSSGTISLSKANVTTALGYTPPTSDTGATTVTVTGTGNAVTTASYDAASRTITLTKGATYNNYTYTLPAATASALGGVKIGSNITVSSGTISLTKANVTAALGYTPPTSDTNTTYSAGTGISLSGTTFSNSGVRSISTGSSNGTISVNTNGTSANVAVKGLGSAAYLASTDLIHSVSLATDGTLRVNNGSGTSILHLENYYLPLTGGTITGNLVLSAATSGTSPQNQRIVINGVAYSNAVADAPGIGFHTGNVGWATMKCVGSSFYFYDSSCSGYVPIYGSQVYGAVWNDYAEYRSQNETIEPGYITYCDDDGKLKKTVERLQKFEGVVSNTFGFAIGETDDCKTPLAVSGRALVYCDPEEHFHSGDCVCAGPDGLAYRMTREEIIEFPDRIVGVVSEIPTYEIWGTGSVEVDGRIWIKVK